MSTIASIPFADGEVAADPVDSPDSIRRKYFVRFKADEGANVLYALSSGGDARFRLYITSIPATEPLPPDADLQDAAKVQYYLFSTNPVQKQVPANEVVRVNDKYLDGWYYVQLTTQGGNEGVLTLRTGTAAPAQGNNNP